MHTNNVCYLVGLVSFMLHHTIFLSKLFDHVIKLAETSAGNVLEVPNEVQPSSKLVKSKTTTKAERRALQDAQRAAKGSTCVFLATITSGH